MLEKISIFLVISKYRPLLATDVAAIPRPKARMMTMGNKNLRFIWKIDVQNYTDTKLNNVNKTTIRSYRTRFNDPEGITYGSPGWKPGDIAYVEIGQP